MKYIKHLFFLFTVLFLGCSNHQDVEVVALQNEVAQLKEELEILRHNQEDNTTQQSTPKAHSQEEKPFMQKVSFEELPQEFANEDFQEILQLFKQDCKAKKTRKIYKKLCRRAYYVTDAKQFVLENFQPYKLSNKEHDVGKLTGYYVASLRGSKKQSKQYPYPIYAQPHDLVSVELSSIYPELKHYRLRGRVEGNKLIPYYQRAQESALDAPVLCYCDSKIDRFFLEVQGSGVVYLDDNTTMHIGYANQNGHRYRSIGAYLVRKGEISLENISLQSIKQWLKEHPERVDEVLNYNSSMVFFRQKTPGTYGSLGVKLTPKRSVAVDRRYIPLGSMLYLEAKLEDRNISKIVFAQDTGGAIKGRVRADYFTGDTKEAEELAGRLNAELRLWLLLPKERDE